MELRPKESDIQKMQGDGESVKEQTDEESESERSWNQKMEEDSQNHMDLVDEDDLLKEEIEEKEKDAGKEHGDLLHGKSVREKKVGRKIQKNEDVEKDHTNLADKRQSEEKLQRIGKGPKKHMDLTDGKCEPKKHYRKSVKHKRKELPRKPYLHGLGDSEVIKNALISISNEEWGCVAFFGSNTDHMNSLANAALNELIGMQSVFPGGIYQMTDHNIDNLPPIVSDLCKDISESNCPVAEDHVKAVLQLQNALESRGSSLIVLHNVENPAIVKCFTFKLRMLVTSTQSSVMKYISDVVKKHEHISDSFITDVGSVEEWVFVVKSRTTDSIGNQDVYEPDCEDDDWDKLVEAKTTIIHCSKHPICEDDALNSDHTSEDVSSGSSIPEVSEKRKGPENQVIEVPTLKEDQPLVFLYTSNSTASCSNAIVELDAKDVACNESSTLSGGTDDPNIAMVPPSVSNSSELVNCDTNSNSKASVEPHTTKMQCNDTVILPVNVFYPPQPIPVSSSDDLTPSVADNVVVVLPVKTASDSNISFSPEVKDDPGKREPGSVSSETIISFQNIAENPYSQLEPGEEPEMQFPMTSEFTDSVADTKLAVTEGSELSSVPIKEVYFCEKQSQIHETKFISSEIKTSHLSDATNVGELGYPCDTQTHADDIEHNKFRVEDNDVLNKMIADAMEDLLQSLPTDHKILNKQKTEQSRKLNDPKLKMKPVVLLEPLTLEMVKQSFTPIPENFYSGTASQNVRKTQAAADETESRVSEIINSNVPNVIGENVSQDHLHVELYDEQIQTGETESITAEILSPRVPNDISDTELQDHPQVELCGTKIQTGETESKASDIARSHVSDEIIIPDQLDDHSQVILSEHSDNDGLMFQADETEHTNSEVFDSLNFILNEVSNDTKKDQSWSPEALILKRLNTGELKELEEPKLKMKPFVVLQRLPVDMLEPFIYSDDDDDSSRNDDQTQSQSEIHNTEDPTTLITDKETDIPTPVQTHHSLPALTSDRAKMVLFVDNFSSEYDSDLDDDNDTRKPESPQKATDQRTPKAISSQSHRLSCNDDNTSNVSNLERQKKRGHPTKEEQQNKPKPTITIPLRTIRLRPRRSSGQIGNQTNRNGSFSVNNRNKDGEIVPITLSSDSDDGDLVVVADYTKKIAKTQPCGKCPNCRKRQQLQEAVDAAKKAAERKAAKKAADTNSKGNMLSLNTESMPEKTMLKKKKKKKKKEEKEEVVLPTIASSSDDEDEYSSDNSVDMNKSFERQPSFSANKDNPSSMAKTYLLENDPNVSSDNDERIAENGSKRPKKKKRSNSCPQEECPDEDGEHSSHKKTPAWRRDRLLREPLGSVDKNRKRKTSEGDGDAKAKRKKRNSKETAGDENLIVIPSSSSEAADSGSDRAADSGEESSSEAQQGQSSQETVLSKGRRNIHKVIEDDLLEDETKAAKVAEMERRRRIAERKKMLAEVRQVETCESGTVKKLVLEVNPETKEELVLVDPHLTTYLKPHQVEGIKFLWEVIVESLDQLRKGYEGGGILAHSMGLGKTLQVIAFLHTVMNNQHTKEHFKRALVISPYNAVLNWVNEFFIWLNTDELSLEVYELTEVVGYPLRLANIRNWHKNGGVLILSYSMFRAFFSENQYIPENLQESFVSCLLNPGPDIVICDEGHLFKNVNSHISKTIHRIKTKRRVVLTGTPLQNDLIEYHCMVQFVRPHLLGTRKEFQNRFIHPIMNGQCTDSTPADVRLMKQRVHVLNNILKGCVQRFSSSLLKPYLPSKQEYVVKIRLSDVQSKLYMAYLALARKKLIFVGNETTTGLFRDYNILRSVWTHPCLVIPKSVTVETEGSSTNPNDVTEQDVGDSRDDDIEFIEEFHHDNSYDYPKLFWIDSDEENGIENENSPDAEEFQKPIILSVTSASSEAQFSFDQEDTKIPITIREEVALGHSMSITTHDDADESSVKITDMVQHDVKESEKSLVPSVPLKKEEAGVDIKQEDRNFHSMFKSEDRMAKEIKMHAEGNEMAFEESVIKIVGNDVQEESSSRNDEMLVKPVIISVTSQNDEVVFHEENRMSEEIKMPSTDDRMVLEDQEIGIIKGSKSHDGEELQTPVILSVTSLREEASADVLQEETNLPITIGEVRGAEKINMVTEDDSSISECKDNEIVQIHEKQENKSPGEVTVDQDDNFIKDNVAERPLSKKPEFVDSLGRVIKEMQDSSLKNSIEVRTNQKDDSVVEEMSVVKAGKDLNIPKGEAVKTKQTQGKSPGDDVESEKLRNLLKKGTMAKDLESREYTNLSSGPSVDTELQVLNISDEQLKIEEGRSLPIVTATDSIPAISISVKDIEGIEEDVMLPSSEQTDMESFLAVKSEDVEAEEYLLSQTNNITEINQDSELQITQAMETEQDPNVPVDTTANIGQFKDDVEIEKDSYLPPKVMIKTNQENDLSASKMVETPHMLASRAIEIEQFDDDMEFEEHVQRQTKNTSSTSCGPALSPSKLVSIEQGSDVLANRKIKVEPPDGIIEEHIEYPIENVVKINQDMAFHSAKKVNVKQASNLLANRTIKIEKVDDIMEIEDHIEELNKNLIETNQEFILPTSNVVEIDQGSDLLASRAIKVEKAHDVMEIEDNIQEPNKVVETKQDDALSTTKMAKDEADPNLLAKIAIKVEKISDDMEIEDPIQVPNKNLVETNQDDALSGTKMAEAKEDPNLLAKWAIKMEKIDDDMEIEDHIQVPNKNLVETNKDTILPTTTVAVAEQAIDLSADRAIHDMMEIGEHIPLSTMMMEEKRQKADSLTAERIKVENAPELSDNTPKIDRNLHLRADYVEQTQKQSDWLASDAEEWKPFANTNQQQTEINFEHHSATKESNNGQNSEAESIREKQGHFVEVNDENWWKDLIKPDERMSILSGKIIVLFDILKECELVGDKALLYSHNLRTLDFIEEVMAKMTEKGAGDAGNEDQSVWVPGIDYFRIDGRTKVDLRRKYTNTINDKTSRARLLMISTKAGCLGINLIGANRVILFDTSWNPANDTQAIFRVFRFGQTKPVYVYRLVAEGTMEEKIYERQVSKESLFCRVVDSQQIKRHFNSSELHQLYFYSRSKIPDTLPCPRDPLLATVMNKNKEWVVGYHEHDSLLQNMPDEDLTEEERRVALQEYEYEKTLRRLDNQKKMLERYRQPTHLTQYSRTYLQGPENRFVPPSGMLYVRKPLPYEPREATYVVRLQASPNVGTAHQPFLHNQSASSVQLHVHSPQKFAQFMPPKLTGPSAMMNLSGSWSYREANPQARMATVPASNSGHQMSPYVRGMLAGFLSAGRHRDPNVIKVTVSGNAIQCHSQSSTPSVVPASNRQQIFPGGAHTATQTGFPSMRRPGLASFVSVPNSSIPIQLRPQSIATSTFLASNSEQQKFPNIPSSSQSSLMTAGTPEDAAFPVPTAVPGVLVRLPPMGTTTSTIPPSNLEKQESVDIKNTTQGGSVSVGSSGDASLASFPNQGITSTFPMLNKGLRFSSMPISGLPIQLQPHSRTPSTYAASNSKKQRSPEVASHSTVPVLPHLDQWSLSNLSKQLQPNLKAIPQSISVSTARNEYSGFPSMSSPSTSHQVLHAQKTMLSSPPRLDKQHDEIRPHSSCIAQHVIQDSHPSKNCDFTKTFAGSMS